MGKVREREKYRRERVRERNKDEAKRVSEREKWIETN